MKIKDGYNGKELEIRIYSRSNGSIEMWMKHEDMYNGKEVLIYLTAQELLDLFKEAKAAGKDLFD